MYFDLSDDQKALRETLMGFFGSRFGQAEGVAAIAGTRLDRDLWQQIGELGLGGIMVREAAGGLDLDCLTLAVVAEVLGYFAVPAPVIANALAAWIIAEAGDEGQKTAWLDRLISGEAVAAFALSESAGTLPEHWTVAAADRHGTKLSVEWGMDADIVIVGVAGGGLAILPSDATGLTVSAIDSLDRTRPLAELTIAGAAMVPIAASPELVDRLLDAMLVTLAADALGSAAAIHARAVDYAKERKQYGQLIGAFQALKHQLADLSVELEPARPLVWYAAHAWDTQTPDSRRLAAITKAHLGEISVNVSRAAIEAFGGIGYTWEYPAHLLLKRAMADRSLLGSPGAHRERAAQMAGWGVLDADNGPVPDKVIAAE